MWVPRLGIPSTLISLESRNSRIMMFKKANISTTLGRLSVDSPDVAD